MNLVAEPNKILMICAKRNHLRLLHHIQVFKPFSIPRTTIACMFGQKGAVYCWCAEERQEERRYDCSNAETLRGLLPMIGLLLAKLVTADRDVYENILL